MFSIRRALAAAGLTVAVVAGVSACSSTVPKDDVAKTIGSKLTEQGITASGVSCPDDLEAEVGKTVRCEFTVEGQPVDAVAKVTSIQGDQANFDITTEARPVAKALLEKKVSDQVTQQAGVAVESTECAGDLAPRVDASTTCKVTGGGESLDLDVKVTSVDGGAVNYQLQEA
jgi:hypothetical protein